jgi:hypothetical protein
MDFRMQGATIKKITKFHFLLDVFIQGMFREGVAFAGPLYRVSSRKRNQPAPGCLCWVTTDDALILQYWDTRGLRWLEHVLSAAAHGLVSVPSLQYSFMR